MALSINQTVQYVRSLPRLNEVIGILLKYGFEEVVSSVPILKERMLLRGIVNMLDKRKPLQYSTWERIRMAAEDLGPAFIKGAQVLSNRPDLLPEQLIKEFQKLQSDVPPFAFEKVVQIIEEDTGNALGDLFKEFIEEPIGAASIGQVHLATLHDGQEVVVKVRRPQVKEQVTRDLIILRAIAEQGEAFFEQQLGVNMLDIVEAFEKSMTRELDYVNEARNMRQFRQYYKKNTKFNVPAVRRALCTERMLVMDRIHGVKITDKVKLREWGINIEKLAERGLDIYLNQIFEHGFFHGDPHPGNILVSEDGTINLIDFGMVGRLSQHDKFAFSNLFIAMASKDAKKMAHNFQKLALNPEINDMRAFENDLDELIDDFTVLDVDESNMGELAGRLQQIVGEYKLRVPGDIFIILRALTILEGIGKELHPTFNIYEYVEPFGRKIIVEQYSPSRIVDQVSSSMMQLLSITNSYPNEIQSILRKLRQGKIEVEIKHKGYEPGVRVINRAINRIALAMITVGLFMGSCIVLAAEIMRGGILTPLGFEYPVLGTLGILLAVGLFTVLFLSVVLSMRRD